MRNKITYILLLPLVVALFWFASTAISVPLKGTTEAAANSESFPIVVSAAVPLYPDEPKKRTTGELTYVAGWELSSGAEHFGGWSGMIISNDQKHLIAISDKGYWMTADLDFSNRSILKNISIFPVDVDAVDLDKGSIDAESIAPVQDGILIGLEQKHRIMFVPKPGEKPVKAPFNDLVNMEGLPNNNGIEAMTVLPNGDIVMFAENGRDQAGTTPAWRVSGETVTKFRFHPPKNYSPTDAAVLPDGDILLLMRKYSALEGVGMKILHISAEELANPIVKGREIAHLASPTATIDNMEALDIATLSGGGYRLFIMSDDNFSFYQRTLFMVYDWRVPVPGTEPTPPEKVFPAFKIRPKPTPKPRPLPVQELPEEALNTETEPEEPVREAIEWPAAPPVID